MDRFMVDTGRWVRKVYATVFDDRERGPVPGCLILVRDRGRKGRNGTRIGRMGTDCDGSAESGQSENGAGAADVDRMGGVVRERGA